MSPFSPFGRAGVLGLLCLGLAAGGFLAGRASSAPPSPVVAALDRLGRVSDSTDALLRKTDTLIIQAAAPAAQARRDYRAARDAIPLHPVTPADSQRAIAELPGLVQKADNAVARDSTLEARQAEGLRLARATIDTLHKERDGWRRLALTPAPRLGGTLAALWDPVDKVPALSAELHVRVTGPWELLARADERFPRGPVLGDRRLYVGVRRTF